MRWDVSAYTVRKKKETDFSFLFYADRLDKAYHIGKAICFTESPGSSANFFQKHLHNMPSNIQNMFNLDMWWPSQVEVDI